MTRKVNENEYKIIESLNMKDALSSYWSMNKSHENSIKEENQGNNKNGKKKVNRNKKDANEEMKDENQKIINLEKSKFRFVPGQIKQFDQSDIETGKTFVSTKHVINTFENVDILDSTTNFRKTYYLSENNTINVWQLVFTRKTRLSREIAYFTKVFREEGYGGKIAQPQFINSAKE